MATPHMVAIRCVQFEVLRAVVLLVAVLVMHDLGLAQSAPDHVFHHNPVFSDVAVTVTLRMIRSENKPVAVLKNGFSGERPSVTFRRTEPAFPACGGLHFVAAHRTTTVTDGGSSELPMFVAAEVSSVSHFTRALIEAGTAVCANDIRGAANLLMRSLASETQLGSRLFADRTLGRRNAVAPSSTIDMFLPDESTRRECDIDTAYAASLCHVEILPRAGGDWSTPDRPHIELRA